MSFEFVSLIVFSFVKTLTKMKLQEALRFRDVKREKLKGKPFSVKNLDWEIKDIIVSNKKNAAAIYRMMYDRVITNEFAIKFFKIRENDFYVYVVSHQWPWGNKELLIGPIDGYLKADLAGQSKV
jgi:hypothetical protein